ncbi:MCE family protein [Aeromicrobium sp. CF3.5]|uniref:MCE family protein n=1 Tax=Aeromicrobium sp. CF3.5 TaxID=3373078 RepID=UPI003EE4DE1D
MNGLQRVAAGVSALVSTALIGGCGVLSGGVYDAPLPGGADVGSDPLRITAEFDDVLDLVPQSSVKVDNVAVGRVDNIRLDTDGQTALVDILVRDDISLPAGTTARLQQTALLGEKYVALVRPEVAQAGAPIADGTRLQLDETSQAAQVEQVLGALSLVLNGGGIGQFQEISRELQKISTGRPEEIKAFLNEMDTFVSGLDDRKEAITGAIDGLARLSETLDADKDKITSALDGLSPGMQVIVDQREQLVAMLSSLDRLSDVTVDTLDAAQDDIVADFELLAPILDRLAASGQALPESLEILLTYPFPDSVLGAIKGDYMNVFIETNFRTLPPDCGAIGCFWPQVTTNEPVGGSGEGAARTPTADEDVPPSLLPPTTAPSPGLPGPTVTVPTPGAGVPPTLAPSAPSSPEPEAPQSSAPPSTPPPNDEQEGDS